MDALGTAIDPFTHDQTKARPAAWRATEGR